MSNALQLYKFFRGRVLTLAIHSPPPILNNLSNLNSKRTKNQKQWWITKVTCTYTQITKITIELGALNMPNITQDYPWPLAPTVTIIGIHLWWLTGRLILFRVWRLWLFWLLARNRTDWVRTRALVLRRRRQLLVLIGRRMWTYILPAYFAFIDFIDFLGVLISHVRQ